VVPRVWSLCGGVWIGLAFLVSLSTFECGMERQNDMLDFPFVLVLGLFIFSRGQDPLFACAVDCGIVYLDRYVRTDVFT